MLNTNVRKLVYSLIIFLMGCAVITLSSKDAEAAGRYRRITVEPESENLDKWFDTIETLGKNVSVHHFRYSRRSNRRTYNAAVKHSRRANCAAFVSWALQNYGVMKPTKTFYAKSSGKVCKKQSFYKTAVKFIRVGKKPKNTPLKPGDIVCWKGIMHVCIYAGKDSHGRRIWYDGGSMACSGGRYRTADKQKAFPYLEKHTIGTIIRIKDL